MNAIKNFDKFKSSLKDQRGDYSHKFQSIIFYFYYIVTMIFFYMLQTRKKIFTPILNLKLKKETNLNKKTKESK